MRLILTSIYALFCTAAIACSEEAIEKNEADGITWGAVTDGLQLGISPPVKLSKTHEIEGFDNVISKSGTLKLTVHLRNTGSKDMQLLPSTWDCLALGDDGAVLASKIILTPEKSDQPVVVTYQSTNHLERILDVARPASDLSQDALRESGRELVNFQVDAEEGKRRQIELGAGEAAWPEAVNIDLRNGNNAPWRLQEKSEHLPPGKYCITAVLVVDQQASDWKGTLTSGSLNIEIPAQATKAKSDK
ncbi:MAG: hypothetical protein ACPGLY_04260 [Rubripirellula sp.]